MDTGRIFGIDSPGAFEECALEIFHYQYRFCVQYRRYCDLMEVSPGSIRSMAEIPFLPIRFFKQYDIQPFCSGALGSYIAARTPANNCQIDHLS